MEFLELGCRSHIQFDRNLTEESKLKLVKELGSRLEVVRYQFDDDTILVYSEGITTFLHPKN